MAHRPDLGHRVVPQRHRERLGALPLRALGVDRTLGLDLDRRCALGLRPFPLRTLGADRATLVLGARPIRAPSPPQLRPRAGGLSGHAAARLTAAGAASRCRLGAAGARRNLAARLGHRSTRFGGQPTPPGRLSESATPGRDHPPTPGRPACVGPVTPGPAPPTGAACAGTAVRSPIRQHRLEQHPALAGSRWRTTPQHEPCAGPSDQP